MSTSRCISTGLHLCSLLVVMGCTQGSTTGGDAELAEQYERYNQQLELTDKQLARNERLLEKQEDIADRMSKLVERWERQADAVDRLLAQPRRGKEE